ncbi:hypothetical protein [Pectobacterium brasiliense]|uniref:hypothetical protein n=1 Tax=Pectobacterium brasiliense TaxID=180957 RepID=UPI0006510175|nr:hypothetical protein [Pectobacterium brasiliense]KMK85839.1 hypothetical protein KCO_00977 [Pectobacterium brasiliense ICMP 19477]
MPQKTKLQILGEIVTDYTPAKHEGQMLPKNHQRFLWYSNFKRLCPASWANPENIPYVAATGLIDAYSQLPRRPDLAFNSLWSATNSSYNDLYLASHLSNGAVLTDSKSIDYSLQRISQQLHQTIPISGAASGSISIIDLFKEYIKIAPDKNFNFVAQYVLRGISAELHNTQQTAPANKVREILISSAYKTFKRKFPKIHNTISSSTGLKFSNLCTISETPCRTDIDFGIQKANSEQTRKLVHATGKILRQEAIAANITTSSTQGSFDDHKHWLSFLVLPLLYATRNTAVHGNAASRLNSIFANGDSISSSAWTFLFGYLYFSLILFCQSNIAINDLEPLYENTRINM